MSQNLQDKILKMDAEQLQKIIANSELYSTEAVGFAKKQIEELERLEKINDALKEKFEAMSREEKAQILKDPDMYNEDIVKLAKAHNDKIKHDFSDVPEEAKAHLTSLSADELMDILDEKEDILSESVIVFIKYLIEKKLDNPQSAALSTENQLCVVDDPSNKTDISKTANKVSVPSGQYSGRKYFLKLVYKTIETDVTFNDTEIELHQGSGFSKAKNKKETLIKYEDIKSVEAKRTISAPSIIFSFLCALLFFVSPTLETFFGVATGIAVIVFLGMNGVTRINHGAWVEYEITTDFKSEAIEAKDKIEQLQEQYRELSGEAKEQHYEEIVKLSIVAFSA